MNKMKYFGIDYCKGQVLFFLRIRHSKNDRQHADGSLTLKRFTPYLSSSIFCMASSIM